MNRSRAWLLACYLHGAASVLLWWWASPGRFETMIWRAGSWTGQPWTLWTSAWVHINTPHLIGNLLALGALATFAWVFRPDRASALAWLLAWPLTQFSLLLWPQVGYAVGLSGLLHAGAMVLAVQLLCERIPVRHARRWGTLLALGVLLKTVLESGWWHPVAWDAGNGLLVVQAAHLTGVVWGTLLGLAVACMPGREGSGFRWPRARA